MITGGEPLLFPDNTDLSLWKVKDMQWIKDCPVPADEEFKRVAELWEVE